MIKLSWPFGLHRTFQDLETSVAPRPPLAHNRLHMALPSEIAALIETFAANEADYTAPEFKEAQVRQQFIDPFFAALG